MLFIEIPPQPDQTYMFDVVVQSYEANCKYTIQGPDGGEIDISCPADHKTQHLLFGMQSSPNGGAVQSFLIRNAGMWTFTSATVTSQ